MEQFVAFLKENYRLLIECAAILVSVLILVFKKTKVNVLNESSLVLALQTIPLFIDEAEKLFGAGKGKEKLKYVFKKVVEIVISTSGLSASSVIDLYGETITQQIENVLETPQKKEKD